MLVLTRGICTASRELMMTVIAPRKRKRRSIFEGASVNAEKQKSRAPITMTLHLYGLVNLWFPHASILLPAEFKNHRRFVRDRDERVIAGTIESA